MSRIFTDTYGDKLRVYSNGDGVVQLDTDAELYYFEEQRAELLADAIYEIVGAGVAAKEIVKASDISYNEGVLRLAAVHDKEVTFRYAKGDGEVIESRQFKPEKVSKNKDGEVYFQGYDPDRDEARNYRVDRILGSVQVIA